VAFAVADCLRQAGASRKSFRTAARARLQIFAEVRSALLPFCVRFWRSGHRPGLLAAAQGMPCLKLIPQTRIHEAVRCVSFGQKRRLEPMNEINNWNDADWFVEWLKLARNEGK
jgi:hypothetical protein